MATFRRYAAFTAVILCAMTAACSGQNPAAPLASPSAPRLDGGATFGSGSRIENNNTTTAADSGSTATRGGATFGSGS